MSKMITFKYNEWKLGDKIENDLVSKFCMAAMERTSLFTEATVKQQITINQSVRTGNLRNSVESSKATRNGSKIVGGATAGSAQINPDPGADVSKVQASSEYAEHVNARKPFMAPALNRAKMKLKAEMDSALRAFSRSL